MSWESTFNDIFGIGITSRTGDSVVSGGSSEPTYKEPEYKDSGGYKDSEYKG